MHSKILMVELGDVYMNVQELFYFLTFMYVWKLFIVRYRRDFPGAPVAKTAPSRCRGPRFHPWSRNQIPPAVPKTPCTWQLRPSAPNKEINKLNKTKILEKIIKYTLSNPRLLSGVLKRHKKIGQIFFKPSQVPQILRTVSLCLKISVITKSCYKASLSIWTSWTFDSWDKHSESSFLESITKL